MKLKSILNPSQSIATVTVTPTTTVTITSTVVPTLTATVSATVSVSPIRLVAHDIVR